MQQAKTWKLFWAPEGRCIAEVVAKDAHAAVKKTPAQYSKYRGEVYAEERVEVRV
jgi:hypothetical protein